MTPEGCVVAHLEEFVRRFGGATRKLSYEARVGAPDRLVLLPGVHFCIEAKRPGAKPPAHQIREHERLRASGLHVYVCDTPESVEAAVLAEIGGAG